jgi:long-chain acyl-CoA synthetase
MTQPATDTCHHIHALFDRRCAAQPDHTFLFMPDGTLTLGQLQQRVDVLEAELRSLGVLPGDRVLIVAENCPEHVALILACSRVGGLVVRHQCPHVARRDRGLCGQGRPRVTYFTSVCFGRGWGTRTACTGGGPRPCRA